MKKSFSISIFIILLFSVAKSQHWVQFSHNFKYNSFQNHAFTGLNNQIDVVAAHRSQYVGLSNRPIASQYISATLPVLDKKFGVGLRLVNDFIGYQRYTSAELSAAYHINIGKSTVSFGTGLGLIQMSLNGDLLRASTGNYENGQVIHNDELLPDVQVGAFSPAISFGALYSIQNFTLGISSDNVISPRLSFGDGSIGTNTKINRTINIHSSYVIKAGNVNLLPSFFYKTDLVKHQFQSTFLIDFNNIYFGAAFRGYSGLNNDALIGIFGVKIRKKWDFTYSYDYNVSGLNSSNSGSHEISLRYLMIRNFTSKSAGNVLYTPRFL